MYYSIMYHQLPLPLSRQMEQNQKSTSDKVKCLAQEAFTNTPPEMKCPVCQQLMVDACLSTCCGQSFCDECEYWAGDNATFK